MEARVCAAEELGEPRDAKTTVVAPLGRTLNTHDTREDRTCDRCRTYVPTDETFHGLIVQPVPWLVLIGGMCRDCIVREGVSSW
ncbi:hypothetical protein [Knoellia koreensis]|uniref:Uncharacterized protein n=1 Tax=Knoellia koreensis TaxID=2730921 RepID=A0A849H478_9MICO|nr:hypothetical protein [Knoellia sp. DB2414S]NNM44586.1 hypothetical protein [Knoellia sp. DB2414S]